MGWPDISEGGSTMDIVFILIIVALYAGTHWLIWALSRLGGVE